MTDLLERLAAANPVCTDDLAPSIEDVWRKLDDDPLPQPARRRMPRTIPTPGRRGLRRLAAVGVGVATAGVALLVLGTTGGGPPSAFAGWTATPTRPASGETQGALDQCRSQLVLPRGGGPSGIPTGGWQPGITDTRGPFTAMVLQSASASATCLSGPSFTSTAATVPGSYLQEWRLGGSTAGGSAPPSVSGLGFSVPGSGPIISQALQADLTTSGGQQYTVVAGQAVAGATRVTLVLSDGSNVQATVGDPSFIAWWPGSDTVSSARAENASGVTTQQLAVTPLSAPPAP